MQAVEHLGGIVIDPVDERGGAWIGGARLALLLVRQRHRAQGQNLVDLGGVEEIAGTLGRDLADSPTG